VARAAAGELAADYRPVRGPGYDARALTPAGSRYASPPRHGGYYAAGRRTCGRGRRVPGARRAGMSETGPALGCRDCRVPRRAESRPLY
jgi:hypothetical protein